MHLEICTSNDITICSIDFDHTDATIADAKRQVCAKTKLPLNRLSLRAEIHGKDLSDDIPLTILGHCLKKLYIKDLGPQVSWKLVFLLEYVGPLLIYASIFLKPAAFYGQIESATTYERRKLRILPFILWSGHYIKRILETLFVHRFSHQTMPLNNMFKNCSYYWIFAFLISYHINHPLYIPSIDTVRKIGAAIFIFCEMGNLSTHLLLRDLRPTGTKTRAIPFPNKNPFTYLFNFVSCPNYTYEFCAWFGFSFVANCLYANLFMFCGLCQMMIWASAKHDKYIQEFENYPQNRKSIIPFMF